MPRLIGDGNGVVDRADFQLHVEAQLLVDFERKFGALVIAESVAGRFLDVSPGIR